MIDPKTYTLAWVESVSKKHGNTDKILVEKTIRALTLLTELKASGLNFIFKGGTALMLLLEKPKRLSIDIDIIITEKAAGIELVFDTIVQKRAFLRYEKQSRIINNKIEKAHYKFFYTPTYKTHSNEEYILLDILFEKNPYNELTNIPIVSPFLLIQDNHDTVTTPSIENILGDKLTAFAPNTTGIPYFKAEHSMSMEIMKQLFDIGNLFDMATDINQIKNSFNTIVQNELVYRELKQHTANDVLDDIIETLLCISTRGKAGKCNFNEIQKGIERVKQFIISERFLIDNAIVAASKAAYIATIIKYDKFNLQKFNKNTDIKDLLIENTGLNKLNKLKKSNKEAFVYWCLANDNLPAIT